jgi:hypothetical protein
LKEVRLPSGAVLKVNPAPFADAKALYQAVLVEMQKVTIKGDRELGDLYKDLFCVGLSSPEVERRLIPCLSRCTYNSGNGDLKIDADTFEPVNVRGDYIEVCMEVAKENIAPFGKSLYAQYKQALAVAASKSPA